MPQARILLKEGTDGKLIHYLLERYGLARLIPG